MTKNYNLDSKCIAKILEVINTIRGGFALHNIYSYSDFEGDKYSRLAASQAIINVSELLNNLTDSSKQSLSLLTSNSYLKKTRNIAAHSYDSLSLPIVWSILNLLLSEQVNSALMSRFQFCLKNSRKSDKQ